MTRCRRYSFGSKGSMGPVKKKAGAAELAERYAEKLQAPKAADSSSGLTGGAGSVTVKIETVAVQVLHGELPETPGLLLQRFHDVRT